ncbi:hypothetical protein TIFTF001_017500 [Ficus carica]|uniref:Uncharacterized protein n=1 Tax=Ficus carica TaxID=3494 RepID=A0AA88DJ17_FICCA|nr:hypothetical protein TIFTF001_017500 [Ficus carica]
MPEKAPKLLKLGRIPSPRRSTCISSTINHLSSSRANVLHQVGLHNEFDFACDEDCGIATTVLTGGSRWCFFFDTGWNT